MDISLLLSSSQSHPSIAPSGNASIPSSSSPPAMQSKTPSVSKKSQVEGNENSFQSAASTIVDTAHVSNTNNGSSVSSDHLQLNSNSTCAIPYISQSTNSTSECYPSRFLPPFSNFTNPILPSQQHLKSSTEQLGPEKNPLQHKHFSHLAPTEYQTKQFSSQTSSSSLPSLSASTCQIEQRISFKPFRCTYPGCDATFGQKGSLTRHIRSRHEKLRPHTCEICQKSFSALWTLRVHQRNVHLKSKPHKCHLCDKSFGELFNKSKHIAIVHEGKRPFACPICSRAFGYKGDMRKHVLELHQQAGRPFQCIIPSCGVKFARKRYLRRHENLSHKGHPLLANRDRSSSPPIPSVSVKNFETYNSATATTLSKMNTTSHQVNQAVEQGATSAEVQGLLHLGIGSKRYVEVRSEGKTSNEIPLHNSRQ